MRSRLWLKFLLLTLAVAAVALSASLLLRNLMVSDFHDFREGEMEDRVYWVTADLEEGYGFHGGWHEAEMGSHLVRALLLGLETRVRDPQGTLVLDTAQALKGLSPSARQRVTGASGYGSGEASADFIPYPLFRGGVEIGSLEVRFLPTPREGLFVTRANLFLLGSSLLLGGLAVLLSVVAARRLTRPIQWLAAAADAIGRGELTARVPETGRDELGRLARTFNAMAQTLEIQERLRRRLYANAAHELRTPLAAMRGELEGMLDGLLPSGSEQLRSLQEETVRLTGIVEGMEALIQAEASLLTLKREMVLLRPFLEGIAGRYQVMAGELGVTLTVTAPAELAVAADPARLTQIVVNLLSNALRASSAGGSISLAAARRDGDTVLTVSDTGHGIPAEERPHIFERFYRGKNGGLGLGLAIVRELVTAHGWRIEVASEVGQGTSFMVIMADKDCAG